jgi:hypothetical protein
MIKRYQKIMNSFKLKSYIYEYFYSSLNFKGDRRFSQMKGLFLEINSLEIILS